MKQFSKNMYQHHTAEQYLSKICLLSDFKNDQFTKV